MTKLTTTGLRHLALYIQNFDACVRFYTEILGMKIEWQPDKDNVYLTTGHDNLALHRAPEDFAPAKHQRLDHCGFIINTPEEVDHWYDFFVKNNVDIKANPRDHRDGARSFYAADPDGNVIQMIYHPPLVDQ